MPFARILAALALACALAPATAAALTTGENVLVSRPSGLGALPSAAGSGPGDFAQVSANGRYVAFVSFADGLAPSGHAHDGGLYVRDRVAQTTTFIGTYYWAYDGFDISDDGSRVVWQTSDRLVPADTDTALDVYVADTANPSATPVLVSVTDNELNRSDTARDPVISGDGQHVAFLTDSNLDPVADQNGFRDIYRRSLAAGTTTLVSRQDGAAGAAAGGTSDHPSIDQDGSHVAFSSFANDLEGGGRVNANDVFVRDVAGAQTTIVSVHDGDFVIGDGESEEPDISADGDEIAFHSYASNLVTGQNDGGATDLDVFRRKVSTKQTVLVSRQNGAGGAIASGFSQRPRMSADGERIMFTSDAALVPGGGTGTGDVFVRTLSGPGAGTTVPVALRGDGARTIGSFTQAFSADGNVAVFQSIDPDVRADDGDDFVHLYARDLTANTTDPVDRPSGPPGPFPGPQNENRLAGSRALSADGRYVLFTSEADGIAPGAATGNGSSHVLVRDVVAGTTELVDRATGASGAILPAKVFSSASLSADGRRVAFATTAPLDPAHPAGTEQVYVRDLDADTTTLVSRASGGAVADADASVPSISGDGRRVSFSTAASNLGVATAVRQLYVRDLAAGTTTLASRSDAGTPGNQQANYGALDGDGDRVVWTTSATNLGDGDTDTTADVHVRDLTAGTTRLVSVSTSGTKTTTFSNGVSISLDGNRIAFTTGSALAPEDTTAGNSAYVRDLAAGITTLVSQGAGGSAGLAHEISWDGSAVAFSSTSSLGAGLPSREHIWLRRLATNVNTLVSRGDGPSGADLPAGDVLGGAALSRDGSCVAFGLRSSTLLPAGASPDFAQVLLRAVGDCLPAPAAPPASDPGPGPVPAPPAPPAPAPVVPAPVRPTPPPAVAVPSKVAQVAALPRTCLSKRRLKITLKRASGVRSVAVLVNGKVKVTRSAAQTAPVDLRGLPAGKVRVEVRVTLTTGRTLTEKRTYKTCAKKKTKKRR